MYVSTCMHNMGKLVRKWNDMRAFFYRFCRNVRYGVSPPLPTVTVTQNEYRIDRIGKTQNATFEGIKPNVPGFFRIGFRFEKIPGPSA